MSFQNLPLITADGLYAVSTASALPPGALFPVGSSRWVLDEGALYYWDGSMWAPLTATVLGETVLVKDNIILLNSDFTSGTPTQDGGISILRGSQPEARLIWDETNDVWTAGTVGSMEPFPGASPAFLFSRSGAVPANTWLLVGGIPSNLTGHHTPFTGKVSEVFIDSSSQSTFTVGLYQHDHVTFSLLATATVTADYGTTINPVGATFTAGQNLAVRLNTGSATDISVGVRIAKT